MSPLELCLSIDCPDEGRTFHDYHQHVAKSQPTSPTLEKPLNRLENSSLALSSNAVYVFREGERLKGTIVVRQRPQGNNQPIEHRGIKVELIGTVEAAVELGGVKQFLYTQETLSGPGHLQPNNVYRFPFDFSIPSNALESFEGHLFRIRYKVTGKVNRAGLSAIFASDSYTVNQLIWVERTVPIDRHLFAVSDRPQECLVGTDDDTLQMAVKLESEVNLFSSDDHIHGAVVFSGPQRLPIVSVEAQLVRRETIQSVSEAIAIARHQIIDGIPMGGDRVEFSFPMKAAQLPFLSSSLPMSPNRTFSVEYSLTIVLIEQHAHRSYFKQLPIFVTRSLYDPKSRPIAGLNEPFRL